MKKIIAVGGRPGTGKTTLFREFIKQYEWDKVEPKKMLPCLYNKELDLYILGKYEEGELFAGTDKLGMNVQPIAEQFVKETSSNVLFEGDRLTNGKFYDHLLSLPDTEISFVILTTETEVLNKRYDERGSNQSETFLKGRETKISKILTNFDYMDNVIQFKNENKEHQSQILSFLISSFNL